jgi:hypothetical protein
VALGCGQQGDTPPSLLHALPSCCPSLFHCCLQGAYTTLPSLYYTSTPSLPRTHIIITTTITCHTTTTTTTSTSTTTTITYPTTTSSPTTTSTTHSPTHSSTHTRCLALMARYDFYALRRPVIGTWYGHDKGNHADWKNSGDEASSSSHRLATMLKWPGSDQSASAVAKLGQYGLGAKRTLEQYVVSFFVCFTCLFAVRFVCSLLFSHSRASVACP